MWHKSGHSTIQLSFSDLQGEREKCLQVQYIVTYFHAWCNFSLHLSIFPLSCWRQPTRVSELLWLWGCSVSLLLWLYSDCREIQLVSQITSETRRCRMLFARDQIGFCVQTTPAYRYGLLHAPEPYQHSCCVVVEQAVYLKVTVYGLFCVLSPNLMNICLSGFDVIIVCHAAGECPPNVVWIWFAEIAFMCVFAVQTKNQSGLNLDMP